MEKLSRPAEEPAAANAVTTSDIVQQRLDKDANANCEFKQG